MKFQKGKSGNQSGRPKSTLEWKKLVQKAATGCLKNIEAIANNPDHEDNLKANIWIAEQAHGKAAQAVEVAGDVSITVKLVKK